MADIQPPQSDVPSEGSILPLRITRVGFVFGIILLLYFLAPSAELLQLFGRERELFSPEILDRLMYSIIQKFFFLSVFIFLLWQLRRLMDDFLVQSRRPFTIPPPSETHSGAIESRTAQINEDIEREPEQGNEESAVAPIDAHKIFRNFRGRMRSEGRRLKSISTRNLSIGIGFSVIALFFIAYPLVFAVATQGLDGAAQPPTSDPINWLARYYVPRLAVGLLLQFVGFFFLRLYVANEQDIKHNSNEITNLEARMMAILFSTQVNEKALFKPVVESLAKT